MEPGCRRWGWNSEDLLGPLHVPAGRQTVELGARELGAGDAQLCGAPVKDFLPSWVKVCPVHFLLAFEEALIKAAARSAAAARGSWGLRLALSLGRHVKDSD